MKIALKISLSKLEATDAVFNEASFSSLMKK